MFSQTLSCDGSIAAVIQNNYCVVPMAILVASPYNLERGNVISARVKALNRIGSSAFSNSNTLGAVVQGLPLQPPNKPY